MTNDDWRVRVEFDITKPDRYRIYLYRKVNVGWGPETQVITSDGKIVNVEEGDLLPDDAGLVIPSGAWQALIEHAAGQSHLGTEVRVLREWLNREQTLVEVFSVPSRERARRTQEPVDPLSAFRKGCPPESE